jgi:hypothetical protein
MFWLSTWPNASLGKGVVLFKALSFSYMREIDDWATLSFRMISSVIPKPVPMPR